MDVEQNLRAYESDLAPEATIRQVITDAYKNLEPELQTIHKYETEQMPTFYDAYNGYGMGTGAADMSPLARLQMASNDVARKSALARTARGIFGVREAGMEDLIGQTYNQWQTGYQAAQNAYDRWWAQKQHEDAMRAQAAQIAAMNRMYDQNQETVIDTGDDTPPPPPGGNGPNWTQKVLNWWDKDSALSGYDYTRTDPNLKNLAASYFLSPRSTILKTIGGAAGNLAGNWNRKDMNFWEKLYDIR
jgi:hypothetical protein